MSYPYPADPLADSSYSIGTYYHWNYDGSKGGEMKIALRRYPSRYFVINKSHKKRNGQYVDGGPWCAVQDEHRNYPSSPVTVYRWQWEKYPAYVGSFITDTGIDWTGSPGNWNDPSRINQAMTDLENRGAEAWSKLAPAKPDISLVASIFESARELPALLQGSVRDVRDAVADAAKRGGSGRGKPLSRAGQASLAVQFGWIPIVKDIRKLIESQRYLSDTIQKLIKNEGRFQRRRVLLDDKSNANVHTYDSGFVDGYDGWGQYPYLVTQCYGPGVHERFHASHTDRIWAEGSFMYWLPPGPRDRRFQRKLIRRIYGGVLPSPSDIYNLMPWSWLIDYFSGVGDFVEAVGSSSVADSVVAKYAYMMRTQSWTGKRERMVRPYTNPKGPPWTTDCWSQAERTQSVKWRTEASPFGWGIIKPDDMSPRQAGILASLGLAFSGR